MPDFNTQRLTMVETQVRTNDVTDLRVRAALGEVPRERFVPAAKRGIAYAEAPIEVVPGRYLLEPRTFSKLLQLASVNANDVALDVACATGYSSAVLARLARTVTALEQDADLVRIATEALSDSHNATVVQGALVEGFRGSAPYNVIVINGAVEKVPDQLLAQLAEGGRLVTAINEGALCRGVIYLREHGRIGHRVAFDAAAPILAGFRESVGFVF